MKPKKSVITFNHFSKDLSTETKTTLYNIYMDIFVKYQCYKRMLKVSKRKCIALDITTYICTLGGSAGSFASVFSLILVPIGVTIGIYKKHQNFERKKEMLRFAYTSYKKVLNEIKAYFRGQSFTENEFIRDCLNLDNTVSDLCPPVNAKIRAAILREYNVKKIIDKDDLTRLFGFTEDEKDMEDMYITRESIGRRSIKSNNSVHFSETVDVIPPLKSILKNDIGLPLPQSPDLPPTPPPILTNPFATLPTPSELAEKMGFEAEDINRTDL